MEQIQTEGLPKVSVPEYRFHCSIVDAETGEIVSIGSTYLSEIGTNGECESVEIEVARTLRSFKEKGREAHEDIYYPKTDD